MASKERVRTSHKTPIEDSLFLVIVMPKVKVNDIQIYYEVHGEGSPLLMIMGLSANLNWWDNRLTKALSEKLKLVMFDNRGAGRTSSSNREYTIKLFAGDAAGLMDALGIPKAHILGFSMGGMIAQELVLNHPLKVEKLVLCSTNCGGSKSFQPSQDILEMLTADVTGLSPEEIVRMILPLILTRNFIEENPDLVKLIVHRLARYPISRESHMRQLKAIMGFDTFYRLKQIKAHTLILHGRKDVLVPLANASVLAKAIPDAELVYSEKSAHLLVEEMREVINILIAFLA